MANQQETVDLQAAVSGWLDDGFAILALYGVRADGTCACGDPDCQVPGKHPRHRHGAHSATRNLDRIRRWVHGYVDLNLGLAADGFTVFDADGRVGERSLERLQELYGDELPATREQQTGNGRHLIYRGGPGTTSTRYTANLPGLHLRGGPGSYVVAAPSRHRNGRHYRVDAKPIAELPAFANEPPPGYESRSVASLPVGLVPASGPGSRYGLVSLGDELGRLLPLEPGQGRHNSLNTAAFRMGQLVGAGQLDRELVFQSLLEAAAAIGIQVEHPTRRSDAERIIKSGLEAGIGRPR